MAATSSIIRLKEANCRNCYKCIRECPVKSIAFKNEQAHIIEAECVLCGHCLIACPQHAKEIVSDIGKVRTFFANKNKVYVSLAPSYAAYYPGVTFAQMSAALKKLGFVHVEETAIGAAKVSEQYEALINEGTMKNIITTACPTVVLLVEKYFPSLIQYLAPVASPVIAHAQAMREIYSNRIKVVFIGPCISKKHDVTDVINGGVLSAALSFEELDAMMEQAGVTFEEKDPDTRGLRKPVARFYPVPGGILKTLPRQVRQKYKCLSIDGMDRCMKLLRSMEKGECSNYFVEMNACEGSCIGGPSLQGGSVLNHRESLVFSIKAQENSGHNLSDDLELDISKRYVDLSLKQEEPSEEEIRKAMERIGKYRKEDELNCGGCGYATCRDKAIAVIRGKAEAEMCLPYMRQRAESMSNTVMEASPNAIIAMDENRIIQEANPTAQDMLKNMMPLKGKRIEEVLPCEMYYDFPEGEERQIRTAVQSYPDYGIVVEQTVVYMEQHHSIIVLLKDITEEQQQQEAQQQMRENTIEITQKVIEKQMRVAQEIASLLGETTAETKVALTKLKKSMSDGGAQP